MSGNNGQGLFHRAANTGALGVSTMETLSAVTGPAALFAAGATTSGAILLASAPLQAYLLRMNWAHFKHHNMNQQPLPTEPAAARQKVKLAFARVAAPLLISVAANLTASQFLPDELRAKPDSAPPATERHPTLK
jgi:hypothetical protein